MLTPPPEQFMTNSFTLSSPSLSALGVAINPTVALCNHACWPNAAVVFPDGSKGGMQVVALRPIGEGEEVGLPPISLPAPPPSPTISQRC